MPYTANPVADAERHFDRLDRQADRSTAAYTALRTEMLDALECGAITAQLQVPRWGRQHATMSATAPLVEVIGDTLAGDEGDDRLGAILRILGRVAAGEDQQREARAWMSAQADAYADFHCDDLADARIGDDGPDPDAQGDRDREDAAFPEFAA